MKITLIFYVGMAVVASLINAARGVALVPLGGHALGSGLAAAVVLAALVIILSRTFSRRFSWAQRLEARFRQALGPLDWGQVLSLAVLSSVGEEMFFRAALQPAFAAMFGSDMLGLVIASTGFGLLHVMPGEPGAWPWTVFALALGFVLGALLLWTGSVLPPILLHLLVNAINLRHITHPDRFASAQAERLQATVAAE